MHRVSDPKSGPGRFALEESDLPVGFLAFAGDRLVAQCGMGFDGNVKIWDTSSGQLVKTIPSGGVDASQAAVSPDGQLVAIATSYSVEIRAAKTGELSCAVETPVGADAVPMSDLDGLAFSPDSKVLAGLLRGNRIIAWYREGQLLMDHSVQGVEFDRTQPSIVPRLQWLPNGTGWLLHGRTICMADPVMVVWRIDHRSSYPGFQNLMVDQNHVFIGGGNTDSGMLVGVTVPWLKVNEARNQIEKRPYAYGAPLPVKVNVVVDNLRFDVVDPSLVADELESILEERLRVEGVKVNEEAAITLTLKYNEESSDLRLSRGDYEQMVPGTRISVEASIRPRYSPQKLWQDSFVSDSGKKVRGIVTISKNEQFDEMGLRNKAVNGTLAWLRRLDLPTVIPNDPDGLLPVISIY